ncbi:alpha/beta hydrolase [Nocardioides sp.]|uniref:alpha/beta hydrolase n=1 Tax=Nocardioides sp. TaxID=35761 RepID=UPI003D11030F
MAVHRSVLGLGLIEESERFVADLLAKPAVPIYRRDVQSYREATLQAGRATARADVAVTQRSVSTGGRTVGIRQFLPSEGPRAGYLYFHGGGWVFGSASMLDAELAELCHELGIAIFSVDYRLAPEHPFPAALEDAETAALWLIHEGRGELGLGRVAIGGASAGAHLAAVALQRLAAVGEQDAFCAANLDYGIFDLSMTPSQRRGADTPRLTRADLEWYYDKVMPGSDAEGRRAPAVSPLYGDLGGMPPARFTVGTLDPLLDDSTFMAERWSAAGSAATLEIYAAATHGFSRQQSGLGALATQREAAFLAPHLGTTIDVRRTPTQQQEVSSR